MAIQEHKLQGITLAQVGSCMWRDANFFGLEVAIGYSHGSVDAGAGCGGGPTILHPRWVRQLGATGSLLENRVHWLVLEGLPGGDIGIANIYASNNSYTRCVLWKTMARELHDTCRWFY